MFGKYPTLPKMFFNQKFSDQVEAIFAFSESNDLENNDLICELISDFVRAFRDGALGGDSRDNLESSTKLKLAHLVAMVPVSVH